MWCLEVIIAINEQAVKEQAVEEEQKRRNNSQ